MSDGEPVPGEVSNRVLTLPNVLSALRLVGVPVFLWLLFTHQDLWAFVVLALSGLTDYLDGKIARRFNLVSRVGQLLDPLADRLYVLSTLVALTIRDIIPLWLLVVLVGPRPVHGRRHPAAQARRPDRSAGALRRQGRDVQPPLRLPDPPAQHHRGRPSATSPARSAGRSPGGASALYWLAAILYAVQAASVIQSRSATRRAAPGAA